MNRDCKEMLKPVDLINIYEVDPMALKYSKSTPNSNATPNPRLKKAQSSILTPLTTKTTKGEKK